MAGENGVTGGGKPRVKVFGSGETYAAGMLTSILNILLSNRFPIDTACGGRAECGRCIIRIRSGAELLSPLREREARKLESLGAGENTRLACQCYARGDVEIEVLNRKKA